MRHRFLKQK